MKARITSKERRIWSRKLELTRDCKSSVMKILVLTDLSRYKQNYANYNIFRKFFFLSVKAKLPEEEFAFFPFNEYMNLCMNDLMGRISSGTWIIWIAFAFFFVMDVYLKAYFGSTISRVSVIMLTGVTNIFVFIPKSRMRAFNTQKQPVLTVRQSYWQHY